VIIIPKDERTTFWFKIPKFFDVDPGSGMEKFRVRDGKKSDPGSGINIPDPQHWQWDTLSDVCRILNFYSFIALGPVTGIGSNSSETRMRMVVQFLNNCPFLTKTNHDILSIYL
jgi:hypothetical protein